MNPCRHFVLRVSLTTLALLAGCTGVSKYMRLAPPGATYRPEDHQSLVIFMRPSSNEPVFQSSVFELTPTEDKLVGIVSVQKKVAYVTTAGEHTFMVIGEHADFLKARLDAGKTYYVLITPQQGTRKVRFTFTPVRGSDLRTDSFKRSVEDCAYVENTPSSYDWARHNAPSIQSKKRLSLPEWEHKRDVEKSALTPEDGI
jgi:hypothetical protein